MEQDNKILQDNEILQKNEEIEESHRDSLQRKASTQDEPLTPQVNLPLPQEEQKVTSASVRCSHILKNGKQCGAFALIGKDLCFSHDPASHEAKMDAVTRGGQSNGIKVTQPLTSVEIKEPKDVAALLVQTISEARSGEIDQRRATIIGNLAGHLLRAYAIARETQDMDEVKKTFGILPPKKYFG